MTTSSLKTRSLEFAVVVAALVVALALAEAYVRVFHSYVRDNVVPGRLFEIDEGLGWKLRPLASGLHQSRYFRAEYRINALGIRDRAREVAKPAGTRRILLYGDSQSFGWGIPEEQRFSNLVEARAAGLEVWNLGVPGYGLDQEILAYERDGQRFEADEVVLLVSALTLSRLPYDYIYRKHKPKFVLAPDGKLELVPVRKGVSAGMSVLYELLSDFYLPHFVEYQLAAARRTSAEDAAADVARRIARLDVGALEQAMLDRALAVARSRGQRLTLLVDFPPALDEAKGRLRRFCAERGIRVIELRFTVPRDELAFGERDPHWKPAVHPMIADQLLDELRR
jgi:hypothetical protein